MASVRSWAIGNGFEYRFVDDSLFERVPAWYRAKAQGEVCPVADLARLLLAQDFLAEGYERTIWADADMLVFAPDELRVETREGFAFCSELWTYVDSERRLRSDRRVNNAISVFEHRAAERLRGFVEACLGIAHRQEVLGKLDVGTGYLSRLHQRQPLPLLGNVGMLSPVLAMALAKGRHRALEHHGSRLDVPLACANLCASLSGFRGAGFVLDDDVFATVVQGLLVSRGEQINRYVRVREEA